MHFFSKWNLEMSSAIIEHRAFVSSHESGQTEIFQHSLTDFFQSTVCKEKLLCSPVMDNLVAKSISVIESCIRVFTYLCMVGTGNV